MCIRPGKLFVPVLLVLCLASAAAGAGAPLPSHRAEYLVTRDSLPVATMVLELDLRPGGGYLYRSTTRPQGALALVGMALDIAPGARVTEMSTGRIDASGFHPEQYRYRRDNDGTRELTVSFDWAQGRAAVDSEDKPWSMAVPEGTLDKLVVLLALSRDLAAGNRSLSYRVADGGKLKTYAYLVQGRREVTTPAGTWEGVEVTRTKEGGPPDYRLWLAPGLSYLPVRVERQENGSLFRMELTSVEGPGGPAAGAGD